MKITKMSLVAALLIGSSAFAIDNIKTSGNVQVAYNTSDAASGYDAVLGNSEGSLFHKDSSAADVALNLNLSADLAKNDLVTISVGAGYTLVTTLGLENNFVSNVWGGSHATPATTTGANYASAAFGGAKVENASWMNEAYAVVSLNQFSKSLLKVGRQAIDTPLAFTETWSVEKNTFEAAVLVNNDIQDTTIVAAFVGNGNGNEAFGQNLNDATDANLDGLPDSPTVTNLGLANGAVVNPNGDFATFGTNGAYAFGVVNNSWKPLTAQAWYYNLNSLATAYWVQADLAMDGILAGVQYTSTTVNDKNIDPVGDASGTFAIMAGYEMKDMVTAKLAFSQTADKGALHGANTATSTAASKLYTEAWWAYGQVTQADTSAITLTVESPVNGIVDLGLYTTMVDHGDANTNGDFLEVTVTASKSFGPLDTTLAVIYGDEDASDVAGSTDPDATTIVQAYLTLNF